ncbi:helix-turn-helix domain-containing protein [Ruminococcus flavefaciens]|jgi:two-component system response regulator YesN|uniref:helix-turn-helix domain-containing protein n=1 Tax=Ruminococcus flavefaciens TaxID=1265 RepID=UPI0004900DE9|nr:AraC family transcriptional regulator [Ruminococcus flavefaciens]
MKKNMEKVNDVKRIDIKKTEELLQSGSLENCDDMLDILLDEVGFTAIESLMLRLYICMEIYVTAYAFSQKLGVSTEKFYESFGTADEIGNELMTVEDTVKFLHTLIRECIIWRIEAAKGSSSSIVAKAKDYIDKNYMNDELSLIVVADAVGLSPSYLSTQFKKVYGQNLFEYLALSRIAHARELLCCTSKMVYEVAYDVGFKDYRYFSQIFKKYTGQTPRQFQNSANICP